MASAILPSSGNDSKLAEVAKLRRGISANSRGAKALRLGSRRAGIALCLAALAAFLADVSVAAEPRQSLKSSNPLPDLSGMAWMGDDLFLVVHDAKNPDELDRPRVSLMALPSSLEGVLWRPSAPEFPGEKSNDLESAARIPGTNKVLLLESADDGGPFGRIFLGEMAPDSVKILEAIGWSSFTKPFNIEASAIARADDGGLMFIWAERNNGKDNTDVNWAKLSLDPFRIEGPVSRVNFKLPRSAYDAAGKALYDRPIVAMDLDGRGRIYIAASLDPEGFSETPDDGPFRSAIYRIGAIKDGAVRLDAEAALMAVLDGLKVESIAVRERDGGREIFVGTDDENYGGILRVLPEREAR